MDLFGSVPANLQARIQMDPGRQMKAWKGNRILMLLLLPSNPYSSPYSALILPSLISFPALFHTLFTSIQPDLPVPGDKEDLLVKHCLP